MKKTYQQPTLSINYMQDVIMSSGDTDNYGQFTLVD